MNDYTGGPCCFGEVKLCHQSFVLCFIVGGREVKANHTFNFVSFWRKKHDTCSSNLFVRRSVCIYAPPRTFICPLAFTIGEFCYEISDDLSLDGGTRAVLKNSLNSIAHSVNRLAASGLLITCCNSLSVRTITVWAWKYGLSLRATVTKAKASFSIGRYLSFVPRSTLLE